MIRLGICTDIANIDLVADIGYDYLETGLSALAALSDEEYEAAARRHEDGQETLSSVLDKLAVSEDAETKLAESAYGEAMSDILLRQAVGIDVIKNAETDEEEREMEIE